MPTAINEESEESVRPMETLAEQVARDDGSSLATKQLLQVEQDFEKLNVAPRFLQEDLVPVDVMDISDTDSDMEEEEEGQAQRQQLGEAASKSFCKAGVKQDSKAVLKTLEEKIAKYKRFLDKAKAKRFSAVR